MSFRKRIYGLLAMVTLAVTGTLATATPASAGTCPIEYPGCGGIVEHLTSSVGPGVDVSNCWSDNYGTVYYGDSPPCTQNRYSTNIQPTETSGSMWFINPGQTTVSYRWYWDTDAFKVRANCLMNFYDGTSIDRRGRGSAWYKIYNWNIKSVTSYRCF